MVWYLLFFSVQICFASPFGNGSFHQLGEVEAFVFPFRGRTGRTERLSG